MSRRPLNCLCQVGAWEDPEWRSVGRLLAQPQDEGWLHRKTFEWVQCVYGLERLGALGPDKLALGVGAGHECVLYYLANRTRLTVGTDLYGGAFAGSIAAEADPAFLTDPNRFAPFHYREDHLAGLPADGLALPFAADRFDVVYSLSSIEHFGGHDKAADAVREMARVLKPGGVACVATEFVLEGGQHGEYFTADDLHHWILAASPQLALVEPIDFTPPGQRYFDDPVRLPEDPLHTPHVVLAIGEWRFTSIVLFFTKRRPTGSALRSRVRRRLGS